MTSVSVTFYPPEQRRAMAMAKLDAFFASVPPALRAEVLELPRRISRMNAGVQVKLQEVLRTADRILEHAGRYAVCTRGCGHCCHVHVPIADFEARYIAYHTGRPARPLRTSIPHDRMEYSAKTPCTFLRDGECSIYPYRPLTCRMHLNFDVDAHWCLHENWRHPDAVIPRPDIAPLMQAYHLLGGRAPIMADIRDFFPD